MDNNPAEKERILTTVEQAKAVQEVGFLRQFFVPTSPSDAAKKLEMPANLAHHHAQRHLSLGLLEEVKREGGKVLYQLTAKLFKVPRKLLPPEDPDNRTVKLLKLVRERFLAAYERSSRLEKQDDPDFELHRFIAKDDPDPELPETSGRPLEPRPAHFQTRTFSLSPAGYQRLVRQINDLVVAAENEHGQPGSGLCTLVFLGMDGDLQTGTSDSRFISSFVPLSEPL